MTSVTALRAAAVLAVAAPGFAPAAPLTAQEPLTLARAIEVAQQQGYQARAALATLDAADSRDRAFYAGLLPQLSLDGTLPSYNRSIIQVVQPDGTTQFRAQDQLSTDLRATVSQQVPWTGGDLFVSSSLARLSVSGPQSVETWSSTPVAFGLRQPILRPNEVGWDRREQPIRSELALRQYREAMEDVAIRVANLFFDVYAARVGLENSTTNAAVNDTLYRLNQGRFEVGKIGENDLLQSELALLRARNAADAARLNYDRARAALRLGLKLPPDAPIDVEVPTAIPDLVVDTTVAVREALTNRASISNAELQKVMAARRVTEARLNNGVGAIVSASYGFNGTGPDRSGAYQDLLDASQFTVAVQIPLVQWGSRKQTVQAARADAEQVENTTRANVEQTAQDAHFAALELDQARRNLALSAKADTVAGRRFEVAYNRYVIGRITIDNLYIAQSEKDQALGSYVQALRGYWVAHYALRRATLFDFETGRPIH